MRGMMDGAVSAVGVVLLIALCKPLWAAEASGTWRHFSKKAGTPGLAGDEIQFIKPATDGGLWIGTLTGLSRYRDGIFQPVEGAGGRAHTRSVWDLLELPGGERLIGTDQGVLSLGGQEEGGAVEGKTVAPLIFFGRSVWALAKGGGMGRVVIREEGRRWALVKGLETIRAEDMALLSDGSLWIIADGDGVYEIPASGEVGVRRHHLAGLSVTSVFRDSRDRIWCPLWGGGLMEGADGTWIRHLGSEKAAMLHVMESPDGRIWAASSGSGLWVYDGKEWKNMRAEDGAISLLGVTSDGRVWISSQRYGGLQYWDGGAWRTAIPGPMPIRCFLRAEDGVLWAGGALDGLYASP